MKQLLKDPRIHLSITLIAIYISSIFFSNFTNVLDYLRHLVLAVGLTIFFDLVFLKLRKIDFFVPTAAATTGLIIAILLAPNSSVFELLTAGSIAMFSKNFIKGSNRHIFNPAGLGVLMSALIFAHPVFWWAASFQPLKSVYFLILLLPLIVSMIRLKRYAISLPFLAVYSFLLFLLNKTNLLLNLTDPTVLFFAFVMLPEPQTTPNKKVIQILFGIFVAAFAIISSKVSSIDPLIFALLTGNLLFYRLK